MKILGLETSCDETAAAIVENGVNILSNVVSSSQEIHTKTGGIIPEKAAREQLKSILAVIDLALSEADLEISQIDALAVTVGPGLIGSLLVGVETAKTLSFIYQKPIIPVVHHLAHVYANWLEKPTLVAFPALVLTVAGGHTNLFLMEAHGVFKLLGETRDDAAGEAFDKTARLLKLPYPGGPSIAEKAQVYLNKNKKKLNLFPRPMIGEDNFDFSFSGLKTAVLKEVKEKTLKKADQQKLAAEVQEAIVDSLTQRTLKAIEIYSPKSFLLAGGAAANKRLRDRLRQKLKEANLAIELRIPAVKFCTDNAGFVASYAFFNLEKMSWREINATPNSEEAIARYANHGRKIS